MLDRFEPPPLIEVQCVDLPGSDRKLIVLEARLQGEARPFTFDGRPYQRIETTTSIMPQERFETLPLAARFPPGQIFREDRLPVPAEALREVLLNAVMHRDYSDPGGYVAVAVFDDRIEVRSVGRLPQGVTAESLSGIHQSVLRNPLIAEAFHRTGAVEIWGRGTNRVIEECQRYGVEPPTFEERAGALFVTFRAAIGPTPQVTPQVTPQAAPQVTPQVISVLKKALRPCTRAVLQEASGISDRKHFRETYLDPLVATGWLEMTIPDKPTSSRQRYRTTEAGKRILSE